MKKTLVEIRARNARYQTNRRQRLQAKGWHHFSEFCPPELVLLLKLTSAKFKAEHPEYFV
jgi:hypothetical protein